MQGARSELLLYGRFQPMRIASCCDVESAGCATVFYWLLLGVPLTPANGSLLPGTAAAMIGPLHASLLTAVEIILHFISFTNN